MPSPASPHFQEWTPELLFRNGEKGWIFDPTNRRTMFTDGSGTTPVSADGDGIDRIEDLSPNRFNGLQATDLDRPLYNTSTRPRGCIETVANDRLDLTATASGVFQNKTYGTMIAFCNLATQGANSFIMAATNNNVAANLSRFVIALTVLGKAAIFSKRIDSDSTHTNSSTASINGVNHVITGEVNWFTGLVSIAIDLNAPETATASWTAGGATSNTASAGVSTGGDNVAGNSSVGDIGRQIAIDRQLSPVERANAIRWCGRPYGMFL